MDKARNTITRAIFCFSQQDGAVYLHAHRHSCVHKHTHLQLALGTSRTINQHSSPLNLATLKHFCKEDLFFFLMGATVKYVTLLEFFTEMPR